MKTIKQLSARSKQLATTASKLANDIHRHMVDIVEFVKATGNVTPATDFINMISTANRRDAIANWFKVYGGMTGNQDDNGVFTFKRDKSVKLEDIDVEAARNESPWTLTKETKWNAFDLNKAIAALVKKAEEKANEEVPEGKEGHKIDVKALEALRAMVA